MKRLFFATVVACLSVLFLLGGCRHAAPRSYGVFIGMEPSELKVLSRSYQTIVVDATQLSQADVKVLRKHAKQVFAYLNVGALEKSNVFYPQFQHLAIEPYDGWPDEYWLDVTDEAWQDFVVESTAARLKEKGVDGLFLDNFDVYDHDYRPVVYQSLKRILKRLKQSGVQVILNGGDTFVRQLAAENGDMTHFLDGINQEEVFYSYDLDSQTSRPQTKETISFYREYLLEMKKQGLATYVIEYQLQQNQAQKVEEKIKAMGCDLYLAPSIGLDQE